MAPKIIAWDAHGRVDVVRRYVNTIIIDGNQQIFLLNIWPDR